MFGGAFGIAASKMRNKQENLCLTSFIYHLKWRQQSSICMIWPNLSIVYLLENKELKDAQKSFLQDDLLNYHWNPLIKTKMKPKISLCIGCKRNSQACQCCVFCKYCHDVHKINEMPNGLCPHMKRYAKEFIKMKTHECLKCSGLGHYFKKSEVIIEQSQASFQKRVDVWQKLKKQNNFPTKRILNKKCSTTKIKCQACSSTGAIERFRFCCVKGCKNCHFSGVVPSRRWQQCNNKKRKEGKLAEAKNKQFSLKEIFCRICQNSFKIGDGQKLGILYRCNHVIHKACVERMRQKRPNYCPQCRDEQADYFAQIEDITDDSNYSENLFLFGGDSQEEDEGSQTVLSQESSGFAN